MFEDECQRASLRRRGVIARGVAKRCLVAFLAFAMAFSTTPAQLWAEGAEGIAEAVAQATTPGEDAALAGGAAEQSGAEVSDSGSAPAASAAASKAATGDEGSATGESPAASEQSSAGHPLAKQDLPPRLPFRQRTRQKPAMSPRSKSRSRSRLSAPMPTARLRPGWHPRSSSSTRARRLRMPSLSCSRRRASRQTTIRTRHTVSTSKAFTPRAMAVRLPSTDDLCLLAAVRRRCVFLGWREQR